jgi:mRNA-degrading endonuclease RelE of RelBE toxin-antitoxin system
MVFCNSMTIPGGRLIHDALSTRVQPKSSPANSRLVEGTAKKYRLAVGVLRDDLRGDVTKLKAQGNRYRLRVGSYRVLFLLEGEAIQEYGVKDRKEAYE